MADDKDKLKADELEKVAGGVKIGFVCERCRQSFPTEKMLFDHLCTVVSDQP